MLVAERFISGLIKICGKHPVSTDGGGTWHMVSTSLWVLEGKTHTTHPSSPLWRKV
jgi:hypothetical protein